MFWHSSVFCSGFWHKWLYPVPWVEQSYLGRIARLRGLLRGASPSTTSFNLPGVVPAKRFCHIMSSMKPTLNRRFLLVVVLCWLPAHAATISYSDSGTFTASTPTTPFSGPSEAWAFSFQANSNPTVLESNAGSVDFAFSNFSYSLDNSPVAIVPTFIRFGSSTLGGGWLMCLNGPTTNCLAGLSTLGAGPQMYTGTTSAPTLIPGAFTSNVFVVFVNTTLLFTQPNTTVLATAAIPEPSTFLSLAAGLLVFGGRRLYRRG